MNIALFTLTRDRFQYTQHCFSVLRQKAGCPYDHFVIDNGSEDGTPEWLLANRNQFKAVVLNPKNRGISVGNNQAFNLILASGDYGLVVAMDNDCEVVSEGILAKSVEAWKAADCTAYRSRWIVAPRVEGINRQPTRANTVKAGPWQLGIVGHVGHLFTLIPTWVLREFRFDESLPKAAGQDCSLGEWFRKEKNGNVAYIEDLVVNHYETTDGQAKRFPLYFQRKWKEEVDPSV